MDRLALCNIISVLRGTYTNTSKSEYNVNILIHRARKSLFNTVLRFFFLDLLCHPSIKLLSQYVNHQSGYTKMHLHLVQATLMTISLVTQYIISHYLEHFERGLKQVKLWTQFYTRQIEENDNTVGYVMSD